MIKFLRFFFMCSMLVLPVPSGASAQSCGGGPLTLQILGSGGPAINSERASSSYLLWGDGHARMLVDMGGGAYLRFGQSGALLHGSTARRSQPEWYVSAAFRPAPQEGHQRELTRCS